jgi:hypothetical protein
MSIGNAYHLQVKHASKEAWREVGPDPTRLGSFQIERNVKAMEQLFQSLGLETRIVVQEHEYDDRG